MTDMTIAVRGRGSVSVPAQICTIHPRINCESEESAGDAATSATALANSLSTRLAVLADAGIVDQWSVDRVYSHQWTRSREIERGDHRRDRDYQPRYEEYVVYSSTVAVEARFVEFGDGLEELITDLMGTENVDVGYLHWDLTDDEERSRIAEVYALAVGDAFAKARAIASAAGCSAPVPTVIGEPGLISASPGAGGRDGGQMVFAAPVADGAAVGREVLSLRPQDRDLTAAVEATFRAAHVD